MNPAQSARLDKERNPSRYCSVKGCLWFTGNGKPCQKHPNAKPVIDLMEALKNSLKESAR